MKKKRAALKQDAKDFKARMMTTEREKLAMIEPYERRAMVGIVIGDRQMWGRDIGSMALRLLLDYAFTVRGLERIYAETYSFNVASQRLMERVGFQREGILRQHDLHNGVRQDMHFFGAHLPVKKLILRFEPAEGAHDLSSRTK